MPCTNVPVCPADATTTSSTTDSSSTAIGSTTDSTVSTGASTASQDGQFGAPPQGGDNALMWGLIGAAICIVLTLVIVALVVLARRRQRAAASDEKKPEPDSTADYLQDVPDSEEDADEAAPPAVKKNTIYSSTAIAASGLYDDAPSLAANDVIYSQLAETNATTKKRNKEDNSDFT
jgi:hypothetical protein